MRKKTLAELNEINKAEFQLEALSKALEFLPETQSAKTVESETGFGAAELGDPLSDLFVGIKFGATGGRAEATRRVHALLSDRRREWDKANADIQKTYGQYQAEENIRLQRQVERLSASLRETKSNSASEIINAITRVSLFGGLSQSEGTVRHG